MESVKRNQAYEYQKIKGLDLSAQVRKYSEKETLALQLYKQVANPVQDDSLRDKFSKLGEAAR